MMNEVNKIIVAEILFYYVNHLLLLPLCVSVDRRHATHTSGSECNAKSHRLISCVT